jgi:phosphate transport system permease protein
MAQAVMPSRINVEVLRGNPARLRRERLMRGLFFSAAFLSVVISVGIVLSLAGGAFDFLRKVPISTLWSDGWFPRNNLFDIKTIVAGTLIVAMIAMLVAVPLGLGAALYLSEYASPRARRWLKPILETLASVPSVVMGFFALTIISPDIVQKLFGSDVPLFNLLAAGIGVGLLVTPLVASVAEDSMHAVPDALREASYGLGARGRATSIRVVVPAAVSGITAAILLGISRAIGETMIVAIVAGGTGGSLFNLDPLKGGQTMTAAITALATGSDSVRGAGPAYPSLFFVGLLLFLMTLGLNLLSERFVRRVRGGF